MSQTDSPEPVQLGASRSTHCYPDWITCCVCQGDMSEPIAEQEDRDDWPDWLNAGCCCFECFQKCSG
jgi:hypothetical protein